MQMHCGNLKSPFTFHVYHPTNLNRNHAISNTAAHLGVMTYPFHPEMTIVHPGNFLMTYKPQRPTSHRQPETTRCNLWAPLCRPVDVSVCHLGLTNGPSRRVIRRLNAIDYKPKDRRRQRGQVINHFDRSPRSFHQHIQVRSKVIKSCLWENNGYLSLEASTVLIRC